MDKPYVEEKGQSEEFINSGKGQKIAYEMLDFAMAETKKAGVQAFTLEVRVSNTPAINLYEKLGFTRQGVRKNFYENPTEDALIMWKY